MRVLVYGSGGREHALAWKVAQEAEVVVIPGNPGIAADAECVPLPEGGFQGVADLCRSRDIDLVVVGPENPLIEGLADVLRAQGCRVYGPGAEGARLEGSKARSKELMASAGVPTAEFESFNDPSAAREYAERCFDGGAPVVVKASGAALGKGVIVCRSLAEAHEWIDRLMVRREMGDAGSTLVLERRLVGREFSLLTICSETGHHSLPLAQDYKRVGEGDTGPNTGGMGAISPVDWVSPDTVREVEDRMVTPILAELARRGVPFRGTLFTGVMVEDGIPYCLEYNVRFGDPEAQCLFPILGSGFVDALNAAAAGEPVPPVERLPAASCTVVIASPGYPGEYAKGLPILVGNPDRHVKVFHAGTRLENGRLLTSGGRVAAVTATGPTLPDARTLAYENVERFVFEGAYYRRDIGLE
ncbi:MAG: phosphoribosylamine--glycine ligase [Fimbriimonadaceae bacterium]|nr:phosphoribosylamine--glycine ligase [Fimbriimonadaceae bacterium]